MSMLSGLLGVVGDPLNTVSQCLGSPGAGDPLCLCFLPPVLDCSEGCTGIGAALVCLGEKRSINNYLGLSLDLDFSG